jgi:putative effector of murein hydrolase LrgA (UPF0299 family)
MKVLKFLKKHRKFIIKWSLVFGLTFYAFAKIHEAATLNRGCEAIGGEMFLFFIPVIVLYYPDIKKKIKEMLKCVK